MISVRLLGPVELWSSDRELPLGTPQRRCVFAILAMNPGRTVSVETLVDRVWDGDPPQDARAVLYTHLSRLRRVIRLAGEDADAMLRRGDGGYVLRIEPGLVDLHQVRALADQARLAVAGSPDNYQEAAVMLAQACALWRGKPLAGVVGGWADRIRDSLCQERLSMLTARFDLELRLGQHDTVIGSMSEALVDYPLNETLAGQLMLALYRSGSQADALATYQRTRQRIVEQLGDEPGPALQHLHGLILQRDRRLDLLYVAELHDALGSAARLDEVAPALLSPSQLPPDVADFTGRTSELQWLDALLAENGGRTSRAAPIASLEGMAGVGKTALAVHWAHLVRERFSAGQLYVDLRGYASDPPMQPIDALGRFLRAFGIPDDKVPAEVDEATAMYRSVLADKAVLVVLDNAAHPDQVRPLLPGGSRCLALVTSRDGLDGLVARDGARRLSLEVLAPDEAETLLRRIVGSDRVGAEPEAVRRLATACAYLPLALRIAAANLTNRPRRTIASYLAELTDDKRIAALQAQGDDRTAVGDALDLSYRAIPTDVQRLYRLLALVPGPDFSSAAAEVLVGASADDVSKMLRRLAGAHLIDQYTSDRYRFHELVRLHARERAEAENGPAERAEVVNRLLAWYLHSTDAAARLLYPHLLRLSVPLSEVGSTQSAFDDPTDAFAWLDAEQANLVAVIRHASAHGPSPVSWLLADSLRGYFWLRSATSDWLTAADAALAAAERDDQPEAHAALLLSLGHRALSVGNYEESIDKLTRSLALARQTGWTDCQAAVLSNLGIAHLATGRLGVAARDYAEATALSRQTGRLEGQAVFTGNLACVYRDLGRLRDAAECNAEALRLYRAVGSQTGEAATLGNIGEILHLLGDLKQAAIHLAAALALHRGHEHRYGEAIVLEAVAAMDRDAGRYESALQAAGAAVELAEDVEDLQVRAAALNTLASVRLRLGHVREAMLGYSQALDLARRAGGRATEISALIGLAACHQYAGDDNRAVDCGELALRFARADGYRLEEGRAHAVLAEVHPEEGRPDQRVHAERALEIHREAGHRLGEAHALVTLGNNVMATNGADAAMTHWRAALDLFANIGAPPPEKLRIACAVH